jgi:hypothetical protein
LSPKLLGPYEVIEQIKNDITCKHVTSNVTYKLHASRVTLFVGSKNDAQSTALLDREEFIVHSVVKHRGNPRKPSSLEFLIRWENYSPEYDTWEPWMEMKKISVVHEYLFNNNMVHIIPSQYKMTYLENTSATA